MRCKAKPQTLVQHVFFQEKCVFWWQVSAKTGVLKAAGLPVRCLCRTRSPVRLPLLQLILLATHFILVAFQRVRFAVLLEGVNDQIRGYLFPCFVDPSQNVEVFRHRLQK